MAGKVLELEQVISKDQFACGLADQWRVWNNLRSQKLEDWEEIRKYVYATDTTTTENQDLPWKNKTTVPKLCQIRDNLHANYIRSLFPKRKWVYWEAYDKTSGIKDKKDAIEAWAADIIDRSEFKNVISRLIYDWIDYGNCFAGIDWVDETQSLPNRDQVGFVGPIPKRISPLDITFNPIAPSFTSTPKIERILTSMGEVKEILSRQSNPESKKAAEELFEYLKDVRKTVAAFPGELREKDDLFNVDGFGTFRQYLASDYVELLVVHGDIYDKYADEYYRNYKITVVDRHKILEMVPNPSYFGRPQIFHAGWRLRQDNIWAMGPLDNLVGMQYRIDHLENLKADVFDLIAFPPLKIKGYPEDFDWGPMERIYVGDEGDVEMVAPDVNALNANLEIQVLEQKMEEMAGSPKEAMGIRSPGEKTKYEVQRLENASGRMFQTKLEQFEEQVVEPLLNGMLEMARRNYTSTQIIRIFSDDFKANTWAELSPTDLTGNGRIRPVAARHFAEQAEKVQNVTAFFGSQVGQDPAVTVHMSGLQIAEMMEDLLDLEGYHLVTPFIRITETAEAQRLQGATQEQTMMQNNTPSGLTPDDHTLGPPPSPGPTPPTSASPPTSG